MNAVGLLPVLSGGVLDAGRLSEVVVRAARPITTSAQVVKGLHIASEVKSLANIAVRGIQVAGAALNGAFNTAGKDAVRIYDNIDHGPFWDTRIGGGIKNTTIWINENINPVYLAFNGINSQFTGQDYLTGESVSHAEGAAQLLSVIPVGKAAKVAELGVEAVERSIVESSIAKARSLGKIGEDAVGITGPKAAIEIAGRTRIPDRIGNGLLEEVKNVTHLNFTRQLRDFYQYSQENDLQMILYTRPNTTFSKPLQKLLDNGSIIRKNIPGL